MQTRSNKRTMGLQIPKQARQMLVSGKFMNLPAQLDGISAILIWKVTTYYRQ